MGKIKIADKKALLKTLITIYSYKNAKPDLLKSMLKIDDALLNGQLATLAEMGILGEEPVMNGPRPILVKRDGAKDFMHKNGMYYSEPEFNERIYQIQRSLLRTMPELITPPEKAIRVSSVDMALAGSAAANNDRFHQKSKKIIKYLFVLVLVLATIAVLIVTGMIK
jgi:hypothetical protein